MQRHDQIAPISADHTPTSLTQSRKDASASLDANPTLIEQMRASGQWNQDWDCFARLDPQWTEQFLQTARMPVARGLVDPKTYEFLAIAVNASCTHMYSPGVRRHTRKALQLGASPEEIMGVLECVAMLGLHSCSLGGPILQEEMARLEAEAKQAST